MLEAHVENMESPRGTTVANQFIIRTQDARYFQSYDSVIVKIQLDGGKVTLDEHYWDYSKTTSRYRDIFLGETKAETEAKIKSGEYELVDLNK